MSLTHRIFTKIRNGLTKSMHVSCDKVVSPGPDNPSHTLGSRGVRRPDVGRVFCARSVDAYPRMRSGGMPFNESDAKRTAMSTVKRTKSLAELTEMPALAHRLTNQ